MLYASSNKIYILSFPLEFNLYNFEINESTLRHIYFKVDIKLYYYYNTQILILYYMIFYQMTIVAFE